MTDPVMDDATRAALDHGQLIDLTTTGAKTGLARRVEIVLHSFDGHLYISGVPHAARRRSWIANIEANSAISVHLRAPVSADLAASARVITDPAERRSILDKVARVWHRNDLSVMVEHSPLIEVSIPGFPS